MIGQRALKVSIHRAQFIHYAIQLITKVAHAFLIPFNSPIDIRTCIFTVSQKGFTKLRNSLLRFRQCGGSLFGGLFYILAQNSRFLVYTLVQGSSFLVLSILTLIKLLNRII